MAYKSDGTVYINTLVDTKGFGKVMNTMQKQVGGLTSAIGKLGLAIAATFAVGKLIQFGKEAIELGSDLQEVQNVVDTTFTTMSDQVNEFARNAAQAAGLSETMAKRYVGTFGAMAKAFDFAEDDMFEMSTSLAQLTGDIASFYNITQDEAYTKLKSVFTGETETLKDLGVVMTQNALDAYAMANGYKKVTSQMTEQEKVALRYKFVLDQLSTASGDFQRTSNGWANQMRILRLSIDSLKADIGQGLINIFTPLLKVLNTVISRLATAAKYFRAFTELFVGKQTAGGGGSPGQTAEDLENIQNGYEGIADAADDAAKANKNLLSGFDELNTFNVEDTAGEIGGGLVDMSSVDDALKDLENTEYTLEELRKKLPKTTAFLENAFERLKTIFENIKAGDWFSVGGNISDIAIDIFNMFSEALEKVDWEQLGNDIGNFIAGIDWLEVIETGFKLKFDIWKAIADVWFGAFEAAPIETTVITAIAGLKWSGLGSVIGSKIGSAIIPSLLAALLGFEAGKEIGKALFPDDAEIYENFTWFGEGGFFDEVLSADLQIHLDAIQNMYWDFGKGIYDWWNETILPWFTIEKWSSLLEFVPYVFKDAWDGAMEWWGNTSLGKWWKEQIMTWFTEEKWTTLLSVIPPVFRDTFKDAVEKALEFLGPLGTYLGQLLGLGEKVGGIGQLIGGINISVPTIKIPALATGAVIPPNAPFMAMLGDQRRGTNIEAPEDLIRQIVREEAGGSREMMDLLSEIARNTKDTADKEWTIGDRAIARATARGQSAIGRMLITEG